jgi:MFS family permease
MGDVVAGRGGTVVAVFQMAGDLGAVLGPIVTGWVADAAGYSPAFAISAAVCVLPVFAVLAAPETLRLPDRIPSPADPSTGSGHRLEDADTETGGETATDRT